MKRILLVLALAAGILVRPAAAQELLVGADFKMYFDNKEFGGNTFAVPGLDIESGTDFAARLAARLGVRWEEKNSLYFGADMLQNFGERSSSFLSEVKPLLYYQFETPAVRAVAGIFTRDLMHDDDYSTAFFSPVERFRHNRLNGVLASYRGQRNSYVEFVCDWEGMYSTVSREKFRILLSGRHYEALLLLRRQLLDVPLRRAEEPHGRRGDRERGRPPAAEPLRGRALQRLLRLRHQGRPVAVGAARPQLRPHVGDAPHGRDRAEDEPLGRRSTSASTWATTCTPSSTATRSRTARC